MESTKNDDAISPVLTYRPGSKTQLLLAYRWPAAVVLSSLVLAAALLKILSNPIPIRIDGGGLQVESLVMPPSVTIRADGPLPVKAGVVVDGDGRMKGQQPIRISGPINVQGINTPVLVKGSVGADVSGQVKADVEAIRTPVPLQSPLEVVTEVKNDKPLVVAGEVSVADPVAVNVDGEVDVQGKVGIDGKVGTRIGF